MGGIGKHQSKFSPSTLEVKTKQVGFPPCSHSHCSCALFSSTSRLAFKLSSYLNMWAHVYCFSIKATMQSKRKRKECTTTVGMGGIGKGSMPNLCTSNARGANEKAGLSSMFPFPVLLSSLILPLPGLLSVPTNLEKQKLSEGQA